MAEIISRWRPYLRVRTFLRVGNSSGGGGVFGRNAADSADLAMVRTSSSNLCEVGQSANPVVIMPDRLVMQLATSGGCAIKRSGTTVEARLGDDSDYARFRAASLITSDTISPAALAAGSNNNYNPSGLSTAYALRLSGDAGGTSTLTGITAQESGRHLLVINISAFQITVVDESASSTAANRILCRGGNIALTTDDVIHLWYDSVSARWRVVSP